MYYYAITEQNGKKTQGIYTPEELHAATFSPESEPYIIPLTAGSKEQARERASEILAADQETANSGGNALTYSEWADLGAFFERIARRFGLVREFRENGVI